MAAAVRAGASSIRMRARSPLQAFFSQIAWFRRCRSDQYRLMTSLVPRWGYAPSLALTFLVTLAVTVIASYAMARWVDQPAVRLADRFVRWARFSSEHLRQPLADDGLRGVESRARNSEPVRTS